jgi:hypothetical protein
VVVGKGLAPVPNTAQPFSHQDDICWTPLLAAVGLTVPGSVLADYSSFPGEHQVSQVIDSTTGRTATAWLTSSVMLGGEDLGSPPAKSSQKAQATGQWLASNGEVGWLTLTAPDSANAQAGAGTLTVWGDAATQAETVTMTFEISAPGNTPSITAGQWKLDGVTFQVTGFGNFSASHQGDVWTVSYSGTIQAGQQPRIVLQVV